MIALVLAGPVLVATSEFALLLVYTMETALAPIHAVVKQANGQVNSVKFVSRFKTQKNSLL